MAEKNRVRVRNPWFIEKSFLVPPKGYIAARGQQQYDYQHNEADTDTSIACLCNAAVRFPWQAEAMASIIYHDPVLPAFSDDG